MRPLIKPIHYKEGLIEVFHHQLEVLVIEHVLDSIKLSSLNQV